MSFASKFGNVYCILSFLFPSRALGVHSSFSVLSAISLIPAHTAVDFSVRFSPLRSCSYAISMTIGSTRTNQLILYLSGRGVSPSIRITPSESEFDLGDLYCVSDLGALKPLERTKRSLALANDSDFDVPVSVDLTKV